jgi:glycerophosphoryl diester phosphodiesterase
MNRSIQNKKRYLYAIIIGTVIFLIGFGITYSVAYIEYQRVIGLQDPVSYQIFQDKMQFTMFEKDICSNDSFEQISQDLAIQGGFIGDLEHKLGKNNQNVLFRKKFYSLIQLEHFEFVKTINEECNKNTNTILFFYSNEEKDLEKSEEVGRILGALYQQNKDNLIIYSFDKNLDSEIIRSLNKEYSITGPMTIIVNENQTLTSLQNINQIQTLLS